MNDLWYVDLDDTFSCYIPQNNFAGAGEVKFIYTEIFRENCYLREGITLHDTAFVLDVGANVGLFSLYVKAKYPHASIMAFEPMPDAYRALRANLEHHKADGVSAIEQALGAKWEPEVASRSIATFRGTRPVTRAQGPGAEAARRRTRLGYPPHIRRGGTRGR